MYGQIQEFYTLPDMPGSLYRVALRLFLGWLNLPELPGGFLCIHRRNKSNVAYPTPWRHVLLAQSRWQRAASPTAARITVPAQV